MKSETKRIELVWTDTLELYIFCSIKYGKQCLCLFILLNSFTRADMFKTNRYDSALL